MASNTGAFPQFNLLDEHLQLHILCYVSVAPFESITPRNNCGTLTHILPLVCKHFHTLFSTHTADFIWQQALLRCLSSGDATLWKDGIIKIISKTSPFSEVSVSSKSPPAEFLRTVKCLFLQSLPRIPHRDLYTQIVNTHLRYTGPVFFMPGNATLNVSFGLHFFEPRYRLLISDVMAPYPPEYRRGQALPNDDNDDHSFEPPTFIYANHAPVAPSPAVIVRVERCIIHGDGRADVFLRPVARVWLEHVWKRPGSGGLCYATVLRMGRMESERLERRGYYGAYHDRVGFEGGQAAPLTATTFVCRGR